MRPLWRVVVPAAVLLVGASWQWRLRRPHPLGCRGNRQAVSALEPPTTTTTMNPAVAVTVSTPTTARPAPPGLGRLTPFGPAEAQCSCGWAAESSGQNYVGQKAAEHFVDGSGHPGVEDVRNWSRWADLPFTGFPP